MAHLVASSKKIDLIVIIIFEAYGFSNVKTSFFQEYKTEQEQNTIQKVPFLILWIKTIWDTKPQL
jgi:hypothetical protein